MTYDYGVAKVRPARPEDAEALAPRLRPADLREIEAGTGMAPNEVLAEGIKHSKQVYAVELPSGEVVAVFGVAPTPEPTLGAVWLLGSDHLVRLRYTFLRHSREWLKRLFSEFTLLGNLVDERNKVHIEWLRWLGFRFLRKVPIGRNGEVFIEFVALKE